MEAELDEEKAVDGGQGALGAAARREHFAQLGGIAVQQRGIGLEVGLGILRLGQQPRTVFQVEVLAVMLQAEVEETVVRSMAGEVLGDFLGAAAQERVAAQRVRPQPFAGGLAAGEDFFAHGLVHRRVLVSQKREQRRPLPFGQSGGRCFGGGRFHDGLDDKAT